MRQMRDRLVEPFDTGVRDPELLEHVHVSDRGIHAVDVRIVEEEALHVATVGQIVVNPLQRIVVESKHSQASHARILRTGENGRGDFLKVVVAQPQFPQGPELAHAHWKIFEQEWRAMSLAATLSRQIAN